MLIRLNDKGSGEMYTNKEMCNLFIKILLLHGCIIYL